MVRVTQFSDTHFAADGARSHGGFGYDTDAAWDAVSEHAFGVGSEGAAYQSDLVVITGDVADHGLPSEYAKAAEKLGRIPYPANVIPGNHDFHVPFESGLPRPWLTMSRTLRLDNWLFVFADSNHAGKEIGADGRLHDRHDRMEEPPELGDEERTWISETIEATDAEHAFLWMHHPPQALGSFQFDAYDAEIEGLLRVHSKLKGMGAGHTHTDRVTELAGKPVFVCPALTINIDFLAETLLPPGYRTYEFATDGTITSTCHLMDNRAWPRHKLPKPAVSWLMGTISYDEMVTQIKGAKP